MSVSTGIYRSFFEFFGFSVHFLSHYWIFVILLIYLFYYLDDVLPGFNWLSSPYFRNLFYLFDISSTIISTAGISFSVYGVELVEMQDLRNWRLWFPNRKEFYKNNSYSHYNLLYGKLLRIDIRMQYTHAAFRNTLPVPGRNLLKKFRPLLVPK